MVFGTIKITSALKRSIRRSFNNIGLDIVKISKSPASSKNAFFSYHYQRHNQRRLEHLASLGLTIASSSVLELGAGIGDHTSFFLDRGCKVLSTDAREEHLRILRSRYPGIETRQLNLDDPPSTLLELFDIIYCYGVLYHLKNPMRAIEFMSGCCRKMLLLETCVSFGSEDLFNPCSENSLNPTQSQTGIGCRPTRRWIYNQLKRHFPFVYLPVTQPNHEDFPINWNVPPLKQELTRAVFIASNIMILNELLLEEIPMIQRRQ